MHNTPKEWFVSKRQVPIGQTHIYEVQYFSIGKQLFLSALSTDVSA
jgi:hypothetical protein